MRALALSTFLALAACAVQDQEPWTVEGKVPFEGTLLYRN